MVANREYALMKMTMDKPEDQFTKAFDSMYHRPISDYLHIEEIYMLHALATDPDYSSVTKQSKFDVYDAIMEKESFVRFHLGTNRIVYRHLFDPTFLLKIGLDAVGISDNLREFQNQQILKPFVPKVFNVTECGTVQMCERVQPFVRKEDYIQYGKEIFDAIQCILRGDKYLLEDIGTNFFMNWGLRNGFGPVVLDFPYVYVRQPDRMHCISPKKNGFGLCGGEIDYDDGYNELICKTCGQRYAAKDVGSDPRYLIEKEMAKRGMSSKEGLTMDENIVFTLTYLDEKGNERTIHNSVNSDTISASVASGILNQKNEFVVDPLLPDEGPIEFTLVSKEVPSHNKSKKGKVIKKPIEVDIKDNDSVNIGSMLTTLVTDAAKDPYEILLDDIDQMEGAIKAYFVEMTPGSNKTMRDIIANMKKHAIDLRNYKPTEFYVESEDKYKSNRVDFDQLMKKCIDPRTKSIIKDIFYNEKKLFEPQDRIDYEALVEKIDGIYTDDKIPLEEETKTLVKRLLPSKGGRIPCTRPCTCVNEDMLKAILEEDHKD